MSCDLLTTWSRDLTQYWKKAITPFPHDQETPNLAWKYIAMIRFQLQGFVTFLPRGHVIFKNCYISTIKWPINTKPGRIIPCNEKFSFTMSGDLWTSWSRDITWYLENYFSPFPYDYKHQTYQEDIIMKSLHLSSSMTF